MFDAGIVRGIAWLLLLQTATLGALQRLAFAGYAAAPAAVGTAKG